MDWEWSVPAHARRKVRISYEDMMGDRTERDVIPQIIFGQRVQRRGSGEVVTTVEQVRGYCLLRREARTFNLGSIGEMIDTETGEDHPDPVAWAATHIQGHRGERRRRATSDEAPADPGHSYQPPARAAFIHRSRGIAIALSVGYVTGRFRLLHFLINAFHWRWGLWL